MTILLAKRIFTSCLIHFHPFRWSGLWWDVLVLCLFLLSASRWTSSILLPDCPLPSLLLVLGTSCREGCWALPPGHQELCVCQVWLCPAHLHPCFIFLHTRGRVEPSPVWFVGFLEIIYLWAPRGCPPTDLVIIITTFVTQWQQNTDYF